MRHAWRASQKAKTWGAGKIGVGVGVGVGAAHGAPLTDVGKPARPAIGRAKVPSLLSSVFFSRSPQKKIVCIRPAPAQRLKFLTAEKREIVERVSDFGKHLQVYPMALLLIKVYAFRPRFSVPGWTEATVVCLALVKLSTL